MSPRTVVRKPVIIVWRRATFSGPVLCVSQSNSGVVAEVLTPLEVVATLQMLLLESQRLVISRLASAVPTVACPRLLLGGTPRQ